jgi:hypothetical protein
MQTQYFFEKQIISQLFIFSAGVDKINKSFNRSRTSLSSTTWVYARLQVSEHRLGGYSHRERWSRTRWRITLRRTMKNYFEKIINEERGRKFRVHGLDISLPSGERIQEPEDFRKSKNWSRKLKKWKFSGSWSHMKSKIEEVKELKNWSFETQPESATRIESRGLLTWICPSGTHGLVYRVRPIKEVEKYKDSKMTWRRRRKVLIRIRLGHL